MKALITGTSSGIGSHIHKFVDWNITNLTRKTVDLDYPQSITEAQIPYADIVINNAGHDLGGKVLFADHKFDHWQRILNTNLVSAMRITQLALQKNPDLIVVNITSTNNDKYWGNDLVYSLSKVALEHFGKMLKIDYPDVIVKEVRLGLTKTEFNNNRYKENHKPVDDLYSVPCLDSVLVANKIVDFINSRENFIRIQP
jgi:NADP-dependent 3-hydroxy acid dehydrogenase YdfG